jgi:cobalamin biosynthesis protein CobT
VWRVLYKSKGGVKVWVTTLVPPEKYRIFRVAGKGGLRKFKAVKVQRRTKEVVFVMAATKSKNTKKKGKKKEEVVTDDELDELESLEDLDEDEENEDEVDEEESEDEDEDSDEDDEDEDEEEDEDDDEDEDEDEEEEEAPKSKKKSKSKKSSDGLIGTKEIADFCGIDGRKLRMVLRSKRGQKIRKQIQDPDTKQYRVKSLKDPAVKELKKLVDAGAAKEAVNESLGKLKDKKAGKKKTSSKKKKSS